MAFEQRPGSGTLFPNDQKGNDRAPAYRGDLALEDGRVIKIAAWRKEGRKGEFLSLAIDKPREEGPRTPASYDDSSEVPF